MLGFVLQAAGICIGHALYECECASVGRVELVEFCADQ